MELPIPERNNDLMGCKVGDYILVRDLQGNIQDYGKLAEYLDEGIVILYRPSRYTPTAEGFKPIPRMTRSHTKIDLARTFIKSTEEEVQGQAPIIPLVEMLEQVVQLNIKNNTQYGRIHQVFPNTLILNPYITQTVNEEGDSRPAIFNEDLPIPTSQITIAIPAHATLEAILTYLKK